MKIVFLTVMSILSLVSCGYSNDSNNLAQSNQPPVEAFMPEVLCGRTNAPLDPYIYLGRPNEQDCKSAAQFVLFNYSEGNFRPGTTNYNAFKEMHDILVSGSLAGKPITCVRAKIFGLPATPEDERTYFKIKVECNGNSGSSDNGPGIGEAIGDFLSGWF